MVKGLSIAPMGRLGSVPGAVIGAIVLGAELVGMVAECRSLPAHL